MRRTNRLAAIPRHEWQQACRCELLAACCAFSNEVNFRRRQAHFEQLDWRAGETRALYE